MTKYASVVEHRQLLVVDSSGEKDVYYVCRAHLET